MKTSTFLIKSKCGREAVMRLPVNRAGLITLAGFKAVGRRFYDGATRQNGQIDRYVNLEDYGSGDALIKAITSYQSK